MPISQDVIRSYIEGLKRDDVKRPFDARVRKEHPDPTIDEAIEMAATTLKNNITEEMKSLGVAFPPLPEDEKLRTKLIHAVAKSYREVIADLGASVPKEAAQNFLQNALGLAGFQGKSEDVFFTEMLSVYTQPNPEEELINNFAKRFSSGFTPEKLQNHINMLGKSLMIDVYKAAAKLNPLLQNDISSVMKEIADKRVEGRATEKELALSQFLSDVYDKVRLNPSKAFSKFAELNKTVGTFIKTMKDVSDEATRVQAQVGEVLSKEEQEQLAVFLAAYQALGKMKNPLFVQFDGAEAKKAGVVMVTGSTGDKYLGLLDSSKPSDEKQYAESVKSQVGVQLSDQHSTDTKDFFQMIALCAHGQAAFFEFIAKLQSKYNIQHGHPLFNLCQYCGSGGQSKIQSVPKFVGGLDLQVAEIFDKKSKEYLFMQEQGGKINQDDRLQFIEEMKEMYQAGRFNPPISAKTWVAMKQQVIQQRISKFEQGDDPMELIEKVLNFCKEYYAAKNTKKGDQLVYVLDKMLQNLPKGKELNYKQLIEMAAQVEALKEGKHRSGFNRFFHVDDTLTKTLKQTFKAIERASEPKPTSTPRMTK